jgi:hypothetical protein
MDPSTRRGTRNRAPKRKSPPSTSGSTDSYRPFARKAAKKKTKGDSEKTSVDGHHVVQTERLPDR